MLKERDRAKEAHNHRERCSEPPHPHQPRSSIADQPGLDLLSVPENGLDFELRKSVQAASEASQAR